MQRNLARAPSRQHPEASQRIKDAVRDWRQQDLHTRPTQEELAVSLGVSKQYVNRLIHAHPLRALQLPARSDAPAPPTMTQHQATQPPTGRTPSVDALNVERDGAERQQRTYSDGRWRTLPQWREYERRGRRRVLSSVRVGR